VLHLGHKSFAAHDNIMSPIGRNAGLTSNGWAAVFRSHSKALDNVNKDQHAKLVLDAVKVPETDVASKVFQYAKSTLPERTFNHSMRVWNYGMLYPCPSNSRHSPMAGAHLTKTQWSPRLTIIGNAIVQTHFPHLEPLLETYFLTCLFHDIGTTQEHMQGTHMSFEYWGAIKARTFLNEHGSNGDQADAVCEAIIRHAELGETGMITSLGLLIQLTTSFGE